MTRDPGTSESGTRKGGIGRYGCRMNDGLDILDGLVSRGEVDPETPLEAALKDPRKRLMFGVLAGAWDELHGKDEELRQEAYCWFQSDDDRSPQEVARGLRVRDEQTPEGLEAGAEVGGYNFVYIANELGFGSLVARARKACEGGVKYVIADEEKACRACNRSRPVTDFHLAGCGATRRTVCKDCTNLKIRQDRDAARIAREAVGSVEVAA